MNHRGAKAKFSPEEDEQLRALVKEYGENDWTIISEKMIGRNFRPQISKSDWTDTEDMMLIQLHQQYGSRWVKIASFFGVRTDVQIKNRYMVLMRKQLKTQREFYQNNMKKYRRKRKKTPTLQSSPEGLTEIEDPSANDFTLPHESSENVGFKDSLEESDDFSLSNPFSINQDSPDFIDFF